MGSSLIGWGLIFLLIAVIAAVLGFGGFLAGTAIFAAKIVFFVAIVVWILSLFGGRDPKI